MKIRQVITLIVGMTYVVLSPVTWAAGHGSGGGGVVGEGFHGGGLSSGGHVEHPGGAVGSRGGGELVLVGCTSQVVLQPLKAQDHAFLHLDIHPTPSLSKAVL